MRLIWLSAALLGVLLVAGVAALLWRRFYRDDPGNAARRVFKNSAVTFTVRLGVKALDMVVLFVLAGTLAAETLADYDLATLLVGQYLVIFIEFGLGVLLTREVARDPGAAQRLFATTLALRLLLIVVGAIPVALLLVGGYALIGQALSATGQSVIAILMLTLLPGAYSGAVTALYNASERMEVPALMELVTAALNFLARFVVIVFFPNLIWLALASAGVSAITALCFFYLQRRHFFAPSLSFDAAAMWALVPLALPLMLNNLLAAVFFRFDVFVVRAFGGPNADILVAQYTRPYQLLNLALIVPPAVTFAVFPLLSRRAGGERAALAGAQHRTLQLLLLLAFPLAMGLAVLAPELIWLFTRANFAQYQPSIVVLAILAWFLPLSFANGLLQYALIAVNQQRAITRAFVLGAVFNLVANLVAIPFASYALGQPTLGLYAAAVITIFSELVLYLVFLPLLRREGLAPPLLALAWRPAAAALAMGLAMLALKLALPAWSGALLAGLLAPPVYAGVLWVVGGIGAEERALALRILGRSGS